jgi:hypothetical protein
MTLDDRIEIRKLFTKEKGIKWRKAEANEACNDYDYADWCEIYADWLEEKAFQNMK